ncbi:uncharacterized protein LOC141909134 [Tubulanus polymorphus]|uniref:uncharacterized protein LOC141909134 n=1 Tax=Tubulanus polymorphus TaxID=672921 RepID=UPI003DA60EE9
MPRKKPLKRKEKLPVSLEQEHKIIQNVLKDSNEALRQYEDGCRNLSISEEGCESEAFKAWCQELLLYWEIEEAELIDVETFQNLCRQNKIDRIHESKDEFEKINDLCERYAKFVQEIPAVKRHVTNAIRNHLFKYCVSFSKELEQECELSPVKEYDQSIAEWRILLGEYLNQIKRHIDDMSNQSKPFINFLLNSKAIYHLIDSVVGDLKKCCHVIRDWLKHDHDYVRELHDTLEKAIKDLKPKKRQKMKVKHSLETIEKSKERNREEILTMEDEFEKLKVKKEALEKRPHFSDPELKSYFRILGPIPEYQKQMEVVKDWLLKLDGNDKAYTRQTTRLTKERKQLSETIYEDEIHITELESEKRDAQKVAAELMDDIRYREMEIETHGRKLNQLTKLYDLKLSPDSLRKIYYSKRWSQTKENDETMTKACDFVSEQIGEDWKQLYVKLPFLPKRAMPKRRNDVEVLDVIYASPRNDANWKTEAKKSLDRWRLLHRRGKVDDLVTSLKKTGKNCLADQLKESFVSA